jgi:hypothetical protein
MALQFSQNLRAFAVHLRASRLVLTKGPLVKTSLEHVSGFVKKIKIQNKTSTFSRPWHVLTSGIG